jgi:hypothetical protein
MANELYTDALNKANQVIMNASKSPFPGDLIEKNVDGWIIQSQTKPFLLEYVFGSKSIPPLWSFSCDFMSTCKTVLT